VKSDADPSATTEVVREVLELVHHHPGRIRVRADVFRVGEGRDARARDASAALRAVPGVTRFDHNARTGSVLIEYEPGLAEPGVILGRLAEAAGLVVADEALARSRTPALVAVGALQELNAIASELTGHKADLRSLVPAGLAALSAYSLATSKEPVLPRWDNLLWWSYSIFLNHHRAEIEVSAEERRLARVERAERTDRAELADRPPPATPAPTPT
jgi:hypothetical protein